MVPLPGLEGRKEIIRIHLRRSSLSLNEEQITMLAELTGGMGGADIANVINEAGQELYHQPDATAEHSWDLCQEVMLKIQFGPIREFPEAIERLAAERVSAKALVGLALSHVPDLVLVSKQCRGDSYGTILLSSRRRDYPQDSQELFELIVFEVAGRVAEEMTYGNVTSAPLVRHGGGHKVGLQARL